MLSELGGSQRNKGPPIKLLGLSSRNVWLGATKWLEHVNSIIRDRLRGLLNEVKLSVVIKVREIIKFM